MHHYRSRENVFGSTEAGNKCSPTASCRLSSGSLWKRWERSNLSYLGLCGYVGGKQVREMLSVSLSTAKKTAAHPAPEKSANTRFILDRKLIYSHHIIARSKRKSLKDLALIYKIGGYVKIGWPGIIIIEGLHSNCASFVQEIKKMKWQYLNVRGEQQVDFESMKALKKGRAFPCEFVELEQEEMSTLASLCQSCGLANLFKTCMKIYENNDEQLSADEAQSSRTEEKK
jgi:hypothetical protein